MGLVPSLSLINANKVHAPNCRPIDGKQNTKWGVPQLHPHNQTFPVAITRAFRYVVVVAIEGFGIAPLALSLFPHSSSMP